MADSPTYGVTLTDKLRTIIKDTAWTFGQMELQSLTGASALVEVTDDTLITTTTGTGAPASQQLHFAEEANATIEQLASVLNAAGYIAVLLEDADPHHATTDLRVIGPTDCFTAKVILSTRRFSDAELDACVLRAVQRHNVSVPIDPVLPFLGTYTAATVPVAHHQFVLLLAQIEVLKVQVMDGVKRRGTDFSVESFSALANALETEYDRTLQRYLTRRNVLTPEQSDVIGAGEIVQGVITREAARYPSNSALWPFSMGDSFLGRRIVPGSQSLAPAVPTLIATALGLGLVKLTWTRNRDTMFDHYEIWRNTTSEVGSIVSNISDLVRPAGAIAAQGEKIRTEAIQVQCIWVDGAMTPLDAALAPVLPAITKVANYWYILYVFNKNGDQSESGIVPVIVL